MARTVATKQSQSKKREQHGKERSPQQEQQTNPYSKILSATHGWQSGCRANGAKRQAL
ncbi:hypothetical protein ACEYW6_27435 [Nostoc sp. UIC 10607]|uniref:hypothetical protein n=1 Tax=Nostoc sp. UIC 10607 TaxID=3045935 RepID=UPI0039A131E9